MSGRPNPFAPSAPSVEEEAILDVSDELMGAEDIVHGPTHPGLSPSLEPPAQPWVSQPVGPLDGLAVMGLHGGAGTSTLTLLLGGTAMDVGRAWPVSTNPWTGTESPIPVIAVARNDHAGLAATEHFIRSWASGQLTGSKLSALVIVEAGPHLSDGRKKATKRLLRMVPRGAHLPWIDAWLDAPPDPARLPRRLKRILKELNNQPRTHTT